MRYSTRVRGCAVIISLLWPVTAFSQSHEDTFFSGDNLYKNCTADYGMPNNICVGYILGAVDVLIAIYHLCLPKDFIGKQVADIVISFLRDEAETRGKYTAASEVDVALKKFRCKDSN